MEEAIINTNNNLNDCEKSYKCMNWITLTFDIFNSYALIFLITILFPNIQKTIKLKKLTDK